jgi:hypothetical protein
MPSYSLYLFHENWPIGVKVTCGPTYMHVRAHTHMKIGCEREEMCMEFWWQNLLGVN